MIDIDIKNVSTEAGKYNALRDRITKLPANAIIRIGLNDTISINALRKLIPDSMIIYRRRADFI